MLLAVQMRENWESGQNTCKKAVNGETLATINKKMRRLTNDFREFYFSVAFNERFWTTHRHFSLTNGFLS